MRIHLYLLFVVVLVLIPCRCFCSVFTDHVLGIVESDFSGESDARRESIGFTDDRKYKSLHWVFYVKSSPLVLVKNFSIVSESQRDGLVYVTVRFVVVGKIGKMRSPSANNSRSVIAFNSCKEEYIVYRILDRDDLLLWIDPDDLVPRVSIDAVIASVNEDLHLMEYYLKTFSKYRPDLVKKIINWHNSLLKQQKSLERLKAKASQCTY
jgi:hypothetical protein